MLAHHEKISFYSYESLVIQQRALARSTARRTLSQLTHCTAMWYPTRSREFDASQCSSSREIHHFVLLRTCIVSSFTPFSFYISQKSIDSSYGVSWSVLHDCRGPGKKVIGCVTVGLGKWTGRMPPNRKRSGWSRRIVMGKMIGGRTDPNRLK